MAVNSTAEEDRKRAELERRKNAAAKYGRQVGEDMGGQAGQKIGREVGKAGGAAVAGAGGAIGGAIVGGLTGGFRGAAQGAKQYGSQAAGKGSQLGEKVGGAFGKRIGKDTGGRAGESFGRESGLGNPPDHALPNGRLGKKISPRNAFALSKNVGASNKRKLLEQQTRAAAGRAIGGAIGSFIPFGGTAVGGWLGGKLAGSKVGKWIFIILIFLGIIAVITLMALFLGSVVALCKTYDIFNVLCVK